MALTIGVPREVFPGEKRVATVPGGRREADQARLPRSGRVRRGRCGELPGRRVPRRGRRDRRHRVRALVEGRRRLQGAPAEPRRSGDAARRRDADRLRLAGAASRADARARGEEGDGARDRLAAAPALARAEDGRADLDGWRQRLPRGDRGGQRVRSPVQRQHHGRGQDPARQGLHRRRGRGGPRRDRHGSQPGRDRARQRHARRGRRPGGVAGRRVRQGRLRGGRLGRRRLRQGHERGLPAGPARDVRQAGEGGGHHHHDRADPGQARAPAHHRGDGEEHEAGQRDRRHGGGAGRQLRADRARRLRGEARGHDRRLHRSREPPGPAIVHALLDQPAAPRRGALQDQGWRPRRQHGGRRDPGPDGHQGRRHHLAATAAQALRRRRPRQPRPRRPSSPPRRRATATANRAARCRSRRAPWCSAPARSCSC